MRMNKRKARLQSNAPAYTQAPNHSELVEKGLTLGLPAFIGSWPTKTLAAKVKELEAARDPA